MRLRALISVVAIIVVIATSVSAHHSSAMFDKSVARQVTATVREFQWTNPHIWIQVYIDDASGEPREWSIEGGGPNSLFRKGWRPNSFKQGDVVTMKIYPMADGTNAGLFVGAKFADGKVLGNW